jgi:peptidoglycan biosynthesis protein MviN/MurJ (putative lipid II flippase)
VSRARLPALYAFFAALSIIANLLAQALAIAVYAGPWHIALSMIVGTVVGLVLKYALDKRWIFHYRTQGVAHEAQIFGLYTVMGIATTAVFWSVEWSFHWFFGTDAMRYLGGALGLAIGYWIKYRLDTRFVFVASEGRPCG